MKIKKVLLCVRGIANQSLILSGGEVPPGLVGGGGGGITPHMTRGYSSDRTCPDRTGGSPLLTDRQTCKNMTFPQSSSVGDYKTRNFWISWLSVTTLHNSWPPQPSFSRSKQQLHYRGSRVPVDPIVTSVCASPSHQLMLSSFVFSVSRELSYIVTWQRN